MELTAAFNLYIANISDPLSREFLNILSCMDFYQHVRQLTQTKGHTRTWSLLMACTLVCPLVLTWLCLTTTVIILI